MAYSIHAIYVTSPEMPWLASYYIFVDISTIRGQILMVQKIKVKSNPSLSWAWPSSVPTCCLVNSKKITIMGTADSTENLDNYLLAKIRYRKNKALLAGLLCVKFFQQIHQDSSPEPECENELHQLEDRSCSIYKWYQRERNGIHW